jgi:hypothetical protein
VDTQVHFFFLSLVFLLFHAIISNEISNDNSLLSMTYFRWRVGIKGKEYEEIFCSFDIGACVDFVGTAPLFLQY